MAFGKDYLYIGIAPRVVALDRATGAVVWATSLPGAGTARIVTVSVDEDRVYAGATGKVYALDARAGTILWQNPLKGYGMADVMFPGDSRSRRPKE